MKILDVRVHDRFELFQWVQLRECELNEHIHITKLVAFHTQYMITHIEHNQSDSHPFSLGLSGLPGLHWAERFEPIKHDYIDFSP